MGPVPSATPAVGGQEEMASERGDLEQIRKKMFILRVARLGIGCARSGESPSLEGLRRCLDVVLGEGFGVLELWGQCWVMVSWVWCPSGSAG